MKRRKVIILTVGLIIIVLIIKQLYPILKAVDEYNSTLNKEQIYQNFDLKQIGQLPHISKIHNLTIVNDLNQLYENNEKAKLLANEVKLLCWVLTMPSTIDTKAKAVRSTWGKRCNILIFISSVQNTELPAVGVDVNEERDNVWSKTRLAWIYIYKNYYHLYDWFLKADDDTFAVPENIRYFLHKYDKNKLYYFGRHFTAHGGYNSGGAGYIFSKETLRLFLIISKNEIKCPLMAKDEDIQIAKCLSHFDIVPSETRDESGLEIFHPYSPIIHLLPGLIKKTDWLYEYSKWEVKTGPDCCSKYSVSFHYLNFYDMYVMDYLIYGLQVYGIDN